MLDEDLEAFNKFLETNKNESRKAIKVISKNEKKKFQIYYFIQNNQIINKIKCKFIKS